MADNQADSQLSGVEADRQALKVAQEAGFVVLFVALAAVFRKK